MKRILVLSLITSALLAQDEYLPLSKISDDKKMEYNFITLDKNIDAKNIEPKVIKEEKNEIVEPLKEEKTQLEKIAEEAIVIEKKDLILKKEIKKENSPKNIVSNKDTINKSILNKQTQREVFFSAQITYSPISSKISASGISSSDDSNAFIPELELQINKHKIGAEYFKNENNYADISLIKLGYKYEYENTNIGADLNYLKVKTSLDSQNEIYPSFEVDFNHNIENIKLSYGAGFGKNSDIDYAYDYFINAGIKPYVLSEASFIAGYKARGFKMNDTKFDFKGPFIGVKSSF